MQVEVEALHRRLACLDDVHGGFVEGDWSEARRGAEALLGAAVTDVDAPVVDLHLVAAQRGNGVDDGQGPVAVDDFDDVGQGRQHAGGGLGVDDADGLDLRMLLQFVVKGLRVDGLAPRGVDLADDGAAALGDVAEADAEVAVAADDEGVAGFEDVGAGRLHGAGAGGRHGHGHDVGGVVHLAQHIADVVHYLEEVGVQVAHYGQGHGLQHTGMHGAGAGAQQQPRGGLQLVEM